MILNNLILSKWLNNSIWPIDETLTGTTNLSQSGTGDNGNEGVLHIPQNSSVKYANYLPWYSRKEKALFDDRKSTNGHIGLCASVRRGV